MAENEEFGPVLDQSFDKLSAALHFGFSCQAVSSHEGTKPFRSIIVLVFDVLVKAVERLLLHHLFHSVITVHPFLLTSKHSLHLRQLLRIRLHFNFLPSFVRKLTKNVLFQPPNHKYRL